MITIYTTDSLGIFKEAIEVDPMAALPKRSSITPPPEVISPQVAQLVGNKWIILDEYPTPTVGEPPVPTSITMRQARLILLSLGLLEQVDATLAAIPDETERKAAQIEWEYAATVDRSSILVQTLAETLNLSEEQLDELYKQASTI